MRSISPWLQASLHGLTATSDLIPPSLLLLLVFLAVGLYTYGDRTSAATKCECLARAAG